MKNKRFLNRKGFTLAEMLLVVAILTVLTAVAAPNVAKYAKGIKLRELDDSARAIYMAAQHDFKDKIAIGKELTPKDTINDVPDRYTGDSSEENISKIDYTIYHGSPEANGLVTVGAIEPELAANSYVIEFNAETGDIYGVFYSIKPDEFDDYETDYDTGKYAAAVNKTSDRVDTLGYYGLENVAVKPAPKPGDVPTPKVSIINKEKLSLTVENPLGGGNAYVEVKVNGVDIVPRSGGYYMSPGGSAEIVLDSLDTSSTALPLELTGKVFEKPFADWATGITPGSELNIEVSFYDLDGLAHDKTKRVTANSLFADGSTPETAHVRYGRHLQNLDKCDTLTQAVIKNTIDFDKSDTADYESWKDTYSGRHFTPLTKSVPEITAASGSEIRNIYIEGEENAGLFESFSGQATNLVFRNPTSIATADGGCAGIVSVISMYSSYENITIINPIVQSKKDDDGFYGMSGGIASQFYIGDTVKNCSVYVETDDTVSSWDDPKSDPFSKYTIKGDNYAGGIAGSAFDISIISGTFSSVKISGAFAGGLFGQIGAYVNKECTVENCFVGGHTYEGKFKGQTSSGIAFDLTDNISGESAGGLFGTTSGNVKIIGKVFSTCSVRSSVDEVDVLLNKGVNSTGGNIEVKKEGTDTELYSLGTAYQSDGTESKESKVKDEFGIKSASDFASSGYNYTARRYDMKVSSVFKYPVPSGMVMHGDWQSGEPVTGFFYWENEDGAYKIRALYYDPQNPNPDGSPKEGGSLGNTKNIAVSESGYGIFCIDGDVDGAEYFAHDGTAFSATPIDNFSTVMDEVSDADKNEKIVNALKEALEEKDDKLKITDSNFKSAVYMTDEGAADSIGSVKAELNGKSFTFAPYFYGLEGGESGFGNEAKPFEVRTAQHLNNVRYFLTGKYFKQTHDLLPGAIEPIGNSAKPFKGSYDGAGKEIINMKIKVSDPNEPAGMFGTTDGATLENIAIRATDENTNFVETSTATPTATALSALVGSPISGIPNEALAAVDGEGFKADVVVGRKDDTYQNAYILLEGQEAKDFLTAYIECQKKGGYQIRLNPTPKVEQDCYIFIMPLGKETPCIELFESRYFSLDSDIVQALEANPAYLEDCYIVIQSPSGLYYEGTPVTVTIGNSYQEHWHTFDDTWTFDDNKHWHECTDSNCEAVQAGSTSEHHFDGEGKCKECGYTKKHEHIWKDAGQKHRCDGCGAEEDHIFSSSQYFNGSQHTSTCEICGKTEYRNHGGKTVKNNVTSHWTECDDCHYKMSYERHSFEEVDGRQVCKDCGYAKPIPAALANNVLGGIVGEAKSTADQTVIKDCSVTGYTLDPDSALVSLLPGGGPTLKFEDYHFSHFYEMIQEFGSSQNFSIVEINTTTPESIAGGYSCEMERLITSAYNAIAAGHPEYEYRFRIQMENGDYTQGSIGNLYFYSPGAQRCAINMVKSEDVGFTVESHDDSRKETIDGKDVTYRVRTALDLIYALEISWPNQGYNYSDFKDFGLYIEGETSYVQGQGSINTGANDQQPSTSNSVIGGIAAKIVAGTSITGCKVMEIKLGDAATAGGIAGMATNCASAVINDNKALVNGFSGSVNKNTNLAGILATKDGPLTLQNNKAAFRNLDTSWQYVFAVAPDADSTNKYVGDAGFANGLHTGANVEKATAISLEEFNNS